MRVALARRPMPANQSRRRLVRALVVLHSERTRAHVERKGSSSASAFWRIL